MQRQVLQSIQVESTKKFPATFSARLLSKEPISPSYTPRKEPANECHSERICIECVLFLVYTVRGTSIRVISARDMTSKERKIYGC
ncbi:BrnT family toxin [bacterium]|nr:BrnT family toxin [bacterium]